MVPRFAMIVVTAACSAVCAAAAQTTFAQTRLPHEGAVPGSAKPWQFEIKDGPVQIWAATLEVRDKTKTATFSGNVQLVLGDTTMRCRNLDVSYDQEKGMGKAAATTSKPIHRMECHGGVTVVTKDESASADLGIWERKTKAITLIGDAVIMPEASK